MSRTNYILQFKIFLILFNYKLLVNLLENNKNNKKLIKNMEILPKYTIN